MLRSDVDAYRKKLFLAGIWIIPFFGPLAVKDLGGQEPVALAGPNEDAEAAPLRLERLSGEIFDLRSCIGLVEGVPVFDEEAFRDSVEDLPEGEQERLKSASAKAGPGILVGQVVPANGRRQPEPRPVMWQ